MTIAPAYHPTNPETVGLPADLASRTFITIDNKRIVFAEKAAHIVVITPAEAEMILNRNVRNRVVTGNTLNKIVYDLRDGNFVFNGSSIVFSTEGTLLDGQNRMRACVKTGSAIEVVLVTGVQADAQYRMDSGSVRTLSQQLQIAGEKNPTQLAATLVACQGFDSGARTHDGSSTISTTSSSLDYLTKNPVMRSISEEAMRLAPKLVGVTAKQAAWFIYALDKVDRNDRVEFFAKLATGADMSEGNPILVLRNMFIADKSAQSKLSSYTRMALVAKAWNAWRDGITVKTLRFKAGGAQPETFPEPH